MEETDGDVNEQEDRQMSEPRVNWVRERLLCTLEDAFRSLRAIVEEGIAEMNAWLNTHEKGYRYEISSDE